MTLFVTALNQFVRQCMLTQIFIKLTRFSSSAKQAYDYAKIIQEMYLRRELVQISDKLSSDTLSSNFEDQNAIIHEKKVLVSEYFDLSSSLEL